MGRERPKFTPVEQIDSYTCAGVCLHIGYKALGINRSEERLNRELKTTKDGTSWAEVINHLLDTVRVPLDVHFYSPGKIDQLAQYRKNGWVVMVCMQYVSDKDGSTDDHFAIVNSIGKKYIEIVDTEYSDFEKLERKEFLRRWRAQAEPKTFVAFKRKEV